MFIESYKEEDTWVYSVGLDKLSSSFPYVTIGTDPNNNRKSFPRKTRGSWKVQYMKQG